MPDVVADAATALFLVRGIAAEQFEELAVDVLALRYEPFGEGDAVVDVHGYFFFFLP
jgi:hypothetical protein